MYSLDNELFVWYMATFGDYFPFQFHIHQFLNVVLKAIHQTTVEFVFPVVLENYFVQFSIRDF